MYNKSQLQCDLRDNDILLSTQIYWSIISIFLKLVFKKSCSGNYETVPN